MINISTHAVDRYIERAEHKVSRERARSILSEAVRVARARQGRGQDMRIKRTRLMAGHAYIYFYIKLVTSTSPKRRVYLAVDENLTTVYTVLTLSMFKDIQGAPEHVPDAMNGRSGPKRSD